MLNIKNLLVLLLVLISTPSLAFMPATGIWGVDSEDNGLPGRGFQIEAENGIIVFTYFGYRADGSSMFYYASGPIVNNTFTSSLLDVQGGTAMGGAHTDAVVAGSAGNVIINFTNGKHGLISFPGEPQRAISKRPFGYDEGPDGLLGTWIFTRIQGQTAFAEIKSLTNNAAIASPAGNGIVSTANTDFICEHQISGVLGGMVICGGPQVTGSVVYALKFAGDRGVGIASVRSSTGGYSASQEMHALRIATKNTIKTGINNGTETSLAVTYAIQKSSVEELVLDKRVEIIEAVKAWTLMHM